MLIIGNFWNIYNLPEYFDTATQPLLDYEQFKDCSETAFGKLPSAFRRAAMWTYNQNCSQICTKSKVYADMVSFFFVYLFFFFSLFDYII